MLKRILTVIMIACFLPAIAYSATWSLSTWVKSAGGSLQVDNGTLQSSANGKIIKYYTDSGTRTVKLLPNSGYMVTSVFYNGITLTNPIETSFVMSGPTAQSLYVSYAQLKYNISASVTGNVGGTVSPANIANIAAGTVFTTPKVFTFTPAVSYRLESLTGIPSGAAQSPAVPAVNQQVTVTFPAGFAVTSNSSIVATFVNDAPIAKAGNSQSVVVGQTVTLNGSTSLPGTAGISSYSWAQTSGPAVTLSNPTTSIASFTPTVAGPYNFSLTVMPGGSTASTTVTAFASTYSLVVAQCQSCHLAAGAGIAGNAFGKWSSSGHKSTGVVCTRCHIGADTGSHPGPVRSGTVSSATFDFSASTGGNFCTTCHNPAIITDFAASKHSIRAGSASCSFCHVGGVHNPNAACVDCHNPVNSQGLTWPPVGMEFHSVYTGTNRCTECHNQHSVVASGCDGCHGAPPATASHLKHFGGAVSQAGYGDLRIAQDFSVSATSYIIGCGNCHPVNPAFHRNGTVEVELYNSQATAGSLKSRNPASAAYVAGSQVITDSKGIPYTEGSCSNVYCHSYNDWTTTAAIPADDPNWQDKVVVTRIYRTASWGGASLGCSGCHGNPTQTAYPANDGGAGDSHAWIDSYGYGNLHTFNMAADPISCSYCHNATVQQKNTFTRNSMDVTTLGDVPISNFSKHVNGLNDVAFDTQKPFVYYSSSSHVSMSLASASYASATKTCSNVSCHQKETSVKWGTPYRVYYDACDKCHGYGGY